MKRILSRKKNEIVRKQNIRRKVKQRIQYGKKRRGLEKENRIGREMGDGYIIGNRKR